MSESGPTAPPPHHSNVLVLSVGNPLRGDDGVGAAILDALTEADSLPEGVTLLDGGTVGLEMALLMQDYRRVIIVDAAEMECAPGEWMRFTPEDAILQVCDLGACGTLHTAGVAEALGLGWALNILPPEIVIYGVQPQESGWFPDLSKPVKQAIPAICEAILEELQDVMW